jgi:hypothetical protein
MLAAGYKGFTITARTYQIRGSGRWTLDLLIGQHHRLRAFANASTYPTEAAAVAACHRFARQIIDSSRSGCLLADLTVSSIPGRTLPFPPGGGSPIPR